MWLVFKYLVSSAISNMQCIQQNKYLLLFSHQVVSNSLWPHGLQYDTLPCPSPSPGVCPTSRSLHRWCRPAISSSNTLFFCPSSFPASETFPISHLFSSGSQNTGASALASVLPMSIQGWSPLRLTGLIFFLSKGLSGVFSRTTVQRQQFFGLLPSLCSSFTTVHDHCEDHTFDYMDLCRQSNVSAFEHTL